MSVIAATIPQFRKMLQNLDTFLQKGVAHAKQRSFEPSVLLSARLAPDQYAFTRQVQAACDAAKFAAARLAGKDPPAHPDTEQTVEELHARIQKVVDYLGTFSAKDFEGAEARAITLSFMPGKTISGENYLVELAAPNFYFHLTTAYAILRHNGVEVGKKDFIGSLELKDA
ncbi:MAG: DUF1993 domain-containing protein [Myxococcales bacterium]|nr:DUF1993 domain-containing protein [Myxococcales bacterium]